MVNKRTNTYSASRVYKGARKIQIVDAHAHAEVVNGYVREGESVISGEDWNSNLYFF